MVVNVAIPVELNGALIVPLSLNEPSAFCGINFAVKYFTEVSVDGKATLTLNDATPPVTVPKETAVPVVVIGAIYAPLASVSYTHLTLPTICSV